jgi:galactose-1-phosphate uridylyltransferase
MVISQKIYENIMGNRGSKSVAYATVKEQRVDGSRCVKTRHLWCTLMGFERNYQVKIPSKQSINKRHYSSAVERSLNNKYSFNP